MRIKLVLKFIYDFMLATFMFTYRFLMIILNQFEKNKISKVNVLRVLREGDTLVVTKLDRFARTISQASDLITKLIDNGIKVDVCNLGLLDNSSIRV